MLAQKGKGEGHVEDASPSHPRVNLQPPGLAAGRGGRHGWEAQHGVRALRLQPRLPSEEKAQDADSCLFLGLLGTNCPGDGKAPEVCWAVHPWAESLDYV